MKSLTLAAVLGFVFVVSTADAHIRITPVGRMGTSDAVKFIQNNRMNPTVADNPGPCANFRTRMATPLQLTPGQTFTFSVQETINHPGRFYVQFSPANDTGFWLPANELARVEDPLNRATTPVSFTVPNVNTNTATIRVLQEMDEQPGEYYVHCVDVNIGTAATPAPTATPPGAGSEGTLSTSKEFVKPGFGGCGMVTAVGNGRGGGPTSGGMGPVSLAVVFLFPLFFALAVRAQSPRVRRNNL
ncbi:MAG: hypothetical protein J0L82_09745 [Deltaproteobacteria bacterium]|jgi:hypothetical protein|nr:hypothetical protein [Deltaproteobacteria bacterium]